MEGYSATIKASSRKLTKKEKLLFADRTEALALDKLIGDNPDGVILYPADWVELEVHNEFCENTDYSVFEVIDKAGTRYTTGSVSFWNSFLGIFNVMNEPDEDDTSDEDWGIKVFMKASRNYSGKGFITCSVI